jgi:aminoglycoside 3-N-acetyltransferase
MMLPWLPARLRRSAKSGLKRIRIRFSQSVRGFSKQDLASMLVRLGVERGDTLFVHSSLDQFSAYLDKPVDVILALQTTVGPAGTVLMPTLPFRGSAVDYVRQPRVFDTMRTPSQMGLLTELFRRSPGVFRSVHPTHAVAAWGPEAKSMLAHHYDARTPCGQATPYGRLLNSNGKILFLGTDITVMTFFHTVEEVLEERMPFSPFTTEVFTLESRDEQGRSFITHTRLFEPKYSRRRRLGKLIPVLKDQGWYRSTRLGGMDAILVGAKQVLEASRLLADRRIFCYDE